MEDWTNDLARPNPLDGHVEWLSHVSSDFPLKPCHKQILA